MAVLVPGEHYSTTPEKFDMSRDGNENNQRISGRDDPTPLTGILGYDLIYRLLAWLWEAQQSLCSPLDGDDDRFAASETWEQPAMLSHPIELLARVAELTGACSFYEVEAEDIFRSVSRLSKSVGDNFDAALASLRAERVPEFVAFSAASLVCLISQEDEAPDLNLIYGHAQRLIHTVFSLLRPPTNDFTSCPDVFAIVHEMNALAAYVDGWAEAITGKPRSVRARAKEGRISGRNKLDCDRCLAKGDEHLQQAAASLFNLREELEQILG